MCMDDYEPSFMPLNEETKEHTLIRAKPPGYETKFFLTHKGVPKIVKRFQMVALDKPLVKEIAFAPEYTRQVRVGVVQTLSQKEKYTCRVDGYFPVIPREEGKYVHEIDWVYDPWSINKSLFKAMVRQEEVLTKCCEMDFSLTNIGKGVQFKSPEVMSNVKRIIRENYRILLDSYKFVASNTVKHDNLFVQHRELFTFLQSVDLVDNVTFTKADYDVIFKAVNYTEIESELNPTSGVVRYEFIETIIRVAVEKYKVKGSAETADIALQMLMDHILPKMYEYYDLTKWLYERLFTENCDIVLRTYMTVFTNIYEFYCFKRPDDDKASMRQEEFMRLCTDLKLFPANIDLEVRKAYQSFYRSTFP